MPILMYHRVIEREDAKRVFSGGGIVVFRKTFEKQMQLLARDWNVISLGRMFEAKSSGAGLPKNTVVVTFDDGWRDNYEHAFPILKQHGIEATIFLSANYIGRNKVFWQERLRFLLLKLREKHSRVPTEAGNVAAGLRASGVFFPGANVDQCVELLPEILKDVDADEVEEFLNKLDRYLGSPEFPIATHSFLTWDQVREMAEGGISFGSHCCSHSRLVRLETEDVRRELEDSRKVIGAELGQQPDMLAYPNGDYNAGIAAMAKDRGYRLAVSAKPGLNTRKTDDFGLRRFNVWEETFSTPIGGVSESLLAGRLAGLI